MTKFLTFGFDGIRPDICDLRDLREVFPEFSYNNGEWCYLATIQGVHHIPDNMRVSDFLQALVEFDPEDTAPIHQFSVTSQEPRFQEFLDAVSGIPGHNIVPVVREVRNKKYTAYLCTFPTSPTFGNI